MGGTSGRKERDTFSCLFLKTVINPCGKKEYTFTLCTLYLPVKGKGTIGDRDL